MATRTVVSITCDACKLPIDTENIGVDDRIAVDGLVLHTKWVTGKSRKASLDLHEECVPDWLEPLVGPGLKVRRKRVRDAQAQQNKRTKKDEA